jgi:hypothetical protein
LGIYSDDTKRSGLRAIDGLDPRVRGEGQLPRPQAQLLRSLRVWLAVEVPPIEIVQDLLGAAIGELLRESLQRDCFPQGDRERHRAPRGKTPIDGEHSILARGADLKIELDLPPYEHQPHKKGPYGAPHAITSLQISTTHSMEDPIGLLDHPKMIVRHGLDV